ncbi:hypothetical protein ILUMI_14330, partial [Ignelater luminosus]
MIIKTTVSCFLTLIILAQARNVSNESIKYYQTLLEEFLQNASRWEQPIDSRRFFSLIKGNEEP